VRIGPLSTADTEAAVPAAITSPARMLRTPEEALTVAHELAHHFRQGASDRDRHRQLPRDEIEAFSASGLWAITVPRALGGLDASYVTVAEVIRIISAADPSIGQIPQNHLGVVQAIRSNSDVAQQALLLGKVLRGTRFGNAFSERGSVNAGVFETTIRRKGDGYVVRGRKFYSSGALFAHLVPISATDEDGHVALAIAERDAPGLTIVDDWSSFGQRTTASGTVILEDVFVPADHVVPSGKGYDQPSVDGPVGQIIQAAVDAGIAHAAVEDTIAFVRTKSRPWIDSGQERASDDPYVIRDIGDLKTRLHAAEALLERAGEAIDAAIAHRNAQTVAAASIAVAEAKILTTEIAILATNKLFELSGTRATLAEHNLDRHWRNARTHTLHDPVRWKHHAIGQYYLNDRLPPRHAWI
jgi:SfnB family sulfur acquisition oxidoreductase